MNECETDLKTDTENALKKAINKITYLQAKNELLEAQIEKMKSDVSENIKWADQNKNNQMYCKLNSMINQWEIKEND